jgi:glyceraldehyde-3-phosphate dehydrogenase/erythrose-4-phosphate dehydrogenase
MNKNNKLQKIPELNGKIDGMTLRVPVSDGSIAVNFEKGSK